MERSNHSPRKWKFNVLKPPQVLLFLLFFKGFKGFFPSWAGLGSWAQHSAVPLQLLPSAPNILEENSENSWIFSKGISESPPLPCVLLTVALLSKRIYEELGLMFLSEQHLLMI